MHSEFPTPGFDPNTLASVLICTRGAIGCMFGYLGQRVKLKLISFVLTGASRREKVLGGSGKHAHGDKGGPWGVLWIDKFTCNMALVGT